GRWLRRLSPFFSGIMGERRSGHKAHRSAGVSMKVIYKEHGRLWNEGAEVLKQATTGLMAVIGRSAEGVTAEWDRTTDATGLPEYNLRLSDAMDSATGSVDEEELRTPRHLRIRLHLLWDGLLRARSHRQLQNLHAMSGTET